MREASFGGLKVRLTGGSDRAGGRPGDTGPLIVLCHGFGAPGDDLVPLWRVLDVPPTVRFAFPEAPIQLPAFFGGGRAWWRIDLDKIQRVLARGAVADLIEEVPEELASVRTAMNAFLDEAEQALRPSSVVIGGFSQGAMLACDVALRSPRSLAGLVLLSGTMIAAREWRPLLNGRRGLRVFQSHGAQDPLLPFAVAELLKNELIAGGLAVDWLPFQGGHEIPGPVLEHLGPFLGRATSPA